jgi:hypothetical protein
MENNNFNPETVKIIYYIFPVVTSIVTFMCKKWIGRMMDRGPSRSKEEETMEFLSRFLAFDIRKRSPIIVEQAFHFALRKSFSYIEILRLLEFQSPSYAIRLYSTARNFFELGIDKSSDTFKGRYERKSYRNWTVVVWGFFYFIFAVPGLYFLLFALQASIDHNNVPIAFMALILGTMLVALAIVFLKWSMAIGILKAFLKEREKPALPSQVDV